VLVISTATDCSPLLHKHKPKKCDVININKVSNKRKCYGLPDRHVCSEKYKQVCENVVAKDSRVACESQIVTDLDTEVCETELVNQCETTHTTEYKEEDKCTTVDIVRCYYGGGRVAPQAGGGGSVGGTDDGGKKGGGKKKGNKGRSKRQLLQAVLLANALRQRHPTQAPATTAAPLRTRPPAPQCYTVPTTSCEKVKVAVDKPETHCKEVEGEKLCVRVPKSREVQNCRNVIFDVPQVSCRHIPWKYCENRPNEECHSTRVIHRGVSRRKIC